MQTSQEAPLTGVALITGGARRIGAAVASALHAAGMRVVIQYHESSDAARQQVEALNRLRPDTAVCEAADLQQVSSLTTLARRSHAHWGRLDVLVNNASTFHRTPFGDITEAAFDDLIHTNFRGPLFLTQACAEYFGDGARVVNIIDTLAQHARPEFVVYSAAKAALWSLTETLAVELAPRVRVNAVAPGHIMWAESTPLSETAQAEELTHVPLGRLGRPEEIAQAVRFLVSPDGAFFNGAVLQLDGGLRLTGGGRAV
ncbi:MAG: SDR family oxidoreductase [Janthinobacterium lividum]